jgi:nitrate/nitrite-specific signal transduction histidine kinase
MRERAVGLGGSFEVERAEGGGARIIVRVPASSDPTSGDLRPPGTEDE